MCKNTEVKVVIIEDDPMVQEVNKKMVEKVNDFIVVATARDGKTGVEHCQIYQPNLYYSIFICLNKMEFKR
ncbi:response regulator [Virgibacillus dokdonensis]|uniref:response regulator n=1 Tax=Virgibacillus dokdonensis TaxID=302167 RepID=UPI0011300F32|nr:hypothetical protein [Virgibacillus dokdonensis]